MKSKLIVLLLLAVFLASTSSIGLTQRSSTRGSVKKVSALTPVSFEERLLATLPDEVDKRFFYSIRFSPDGLKVAYKTRRANKEFVVVGDKKGPDFDEVGIPVFGPNAATIAYRAKQNNKWSVLVGDKPGPQYDQLWSDPIFSPDGSKVAYLVDENGRRYAVMGNKRGPDFLRIRDLTFSPDSSKIVYVATDYLRPELDQKKRGGGEVIEKDGRFVPLAQFVVVNGQIAGDVFREVRAPIFTSDGKHFLYEAFENYSGTDDCRVCVVLEDRWLKPNTQALGVGAMFTPGNEIAYKTQRFLDKNYTKRVSRLVLGDKIGPEFSGSIQTVVFSPNGRRVAYQVISDQSSYIVIDDKKGADHEQPTDQTVSSIAFSPDSRRIAYRLGKDGRDMIVIDGQVGPQFDQGGWLLVFSPNGKKLAYNVKKNGRWFVGIEDGTGLSHIGAACDEILTRLFFSPDSKRVAYGARVGRELWWKVMETE